MNSSCDQTGKHRGKPARGKIFPQEVLQEGYGLIKNKKTQGLLDKWESYASSFA